MHLSARRALACFTVLLFIPAQVRAQCYMARPRTFHNHPRCCTAVSKDNFNRKIISCFEQQKMAFSHCAVDAYIFFTDKEKFCVDPEASWLPTRFKRLEEKGICCLRI